VNLNLHSEFEFIQYNDSWMLKNIHVDLLIYTIFDVNLQVLHFCTKLVIFLCLSPKDFFICELHASHYVYVDYVFWFVCVTLWKPICNAFFMANA